MFAICMACAAPLKDWTIKDNFLGQPLQICTTCTHIQLKQEPPQEAVLRYYEGEYSKNRADYVNETYHGIMAKRAIAQVSYIKQFIPLQNKRVLDIGCGYGWLVKELGQYASEVRGIEYDDRCIAHATEVLHQKVSKISEEADILNMEQQDLVCMSHVFEHLMRPEALMDKLKTKAGYIFIEIPAYSPYIAEQWLDLQGHTSFFSLSNFEKFLQRMGFDVLDVSGYGMSQLFYWRKSTIRLRNWFCKYIFHDWYMNQYDRPNPNGIWLRAFLRCMR